MTMKTSWYCAAVLASVLVIVVNASLPTPLNQHDFASATYRLYRVDKSLVVADVSTAAPKSSTLLGTAISNRSYEVVGWDFLQVTTDSFYHAGYLEGYLTWDRIVNTTIAAGIELSPDAMRWVTEHVAYLEKNTGGTQHDGTFTTNFWVQVGHLLDQVRGLADGFNAATAAAKQPPSLSNITFFDMFLLNFANEIWDVENAVKNQNFRSTTLRQGGGDRCSGFIKVMPDDLFFAHATWSLYSTMLRQYKVYQLPATAVSFSGYPGQIASGDDWYILSSNMLAQETTNDYANYTVAVEYIHPHSVSEFLRVTTANYLAQSGPEWAMLFAYNNSGTYCNQYMVIDLKQYNPGDVGGALASNLLWIVEQMPGNVTAGDETNVLRSAGYWASYNIPYFTNIFNASGFLQLEVEFGPFFSYSQYARPLIFKRNDSDVVDLASLQRLMRYNNWEEDPLSDIPLCSECVPHRSPKLSIAKRGDLVPNYTTPPSNPAYADYFVYRERRGAIDAKITSWKQFQNSQQGVVICGPTSDQQPVFVYDMAFPGERCPGCANEYNFPWVAFNVVSVEPASTSTRDDAIVAATVGVVVLIVLTVVGVRHWRQRETTASEKQSLLND